MWLPKIYLAENKNSTDASNFTFKLRKKDFTHTPQSCKMIHTCVISWKQLLWKSLLELARLFSVLVWKVSVCQAFKHCPSVLPLYLVWLVSSHYCHFVFGRASRASMEKGRRAVCAQPGHLAAQRGRGRGGRRSRGSGSAGKRDIPLLFLSRVFSQAFCSFSAPFFLFIPAFTLCPCHFQLSYPSLV